MIKILNAEPCHYSSKASEILRELGDLTEVALDRQGLLSSISAFNVLIVRLGFKIDREILDAASKLQLIVTATTGLDHIELEYAMGKGIEILSLQGEYEFLRSIPATAELTWALLLALTRNIPSAVATVHAGMWDRYRLRGHDLSGKRFGIVGLGRIGSMVARYGLVFGMKVSAFDPYRQDWLPGVERQEILLNLLESTDVLSLHVPLNAETHHIIGNNELQAMPEHGLLINTSRGAIVDSNALLENLQKGRLAGAALDVIEGEIDVTELMKNQLFSHAREHSNLIITPHIGGATFESMEATEVFMANKLKAWIGRMPVQQ